MTKRKATQASDTHPSNVVPFGPAVTLDQLSVDKRGTRLVDVVSQELQDLVRRVTAPHTGEVASLSLKLEVSDRGDGYAVIKPVLKATAPAIHFAPRSTQVTESGQVVPEGTVDQLSFDDLARREVELAAQFKAAQREAREALQPKEPEGHETPAEDVAEEAEAFTGGGDE